MYCLFEMETPTLRLPWNHTLTTNEEAKEGWSMKQLERMSNKKKEAWLKACKQVMAATDGGCCDSQSVWSTPPPFAVRNCTACQSCIGGILVCFGSTTDLYSLPLCLQGEVPEYLMGLFNYITSVGPREVPDYEWLVAQLESGITGQPPSRPPLRTQIDDWPRPGEFYSRADFTMVGGAGGAELRQNVGHQLAYKHN